MTKLSGYTAAQISRMSDADVARHYAAMGGTLRGDETPGKMFWMWREVACRYLNSTRRCGNDLEDRLEHGDRRGRQ